MVEARERGGEGSHSIRFLGTIPGDRSIFRGKKGGKKEKKKKIRPVRFSSVALKRTKGKKKGKKKILNTCHPSCRKGGGGGFVAKLEKKKKKAMDP